jgi:hypothetical protein
VYTYTQTRFAFIRIVASAGPSVAQYIPALTSRLLSHFENAELVEFLAFLGLVLHRLGVSRAYRVSRCTTEISLASLERGCGHAGSAHHTPQHSHRIYNVSASGWDGRPAISSRIQEGLLGVLGYHNDRKSLHDIRIRT